MKNLGGIILIILILGLLAYFFLNSNSSGVPSFNEAQDASTYEDKPENIEEGFTRDSSTRLAP